MAWPLSQDYNEALQNPQTSFSDAELRQGQVVVNALGIPQPCSGNFADVYAVECPASKTKWAVKCFTREVHGLRERYSAISQYLAQARLPFTVDFQYLEQGIRIAGRWYPVLKMHWVEGFTLNAFVRDVLDKPAMLDALSRIWLRMAGRLREAQLAHADLQHGNVLLVPGSTASSLAVKLIDYDGMWVPALANTPSGEVGHPAYQHPQRLRDGVYRPEVDHFPLLVIYVALRALSVGGRPLWERYDTGDNLLFRQADFESPARSALFAELLRMQQPEVRELVVKLIDAARLPLEQAPHLTDLVAVEVPPRPAAAAKRPSTAISATAFAPVMEAFAQESAPIIRLRSGQQRSKMPLVAASAVVLAVLGVAAVFWGLRSNGTSGKPSTSTVVAQAKNEGTPSAPGEKQLPAKGDDKASRDEAAEPSDPSHHPSTNPVKPAEARGAIFYGPLGEARRFEGHPDTVFSVAFSPDGQRALSAGGGDNSVRLWDIASGEPIHTLNGHTQMVWSVAFSPDGQRAVSAAYDGTVRVWDLKKGEGIQIFREHANPVRRAVFTPDGKQILSAGWDRMVRRWEVESAREVRRYAGNQSNIYWMALSPDGKRVLSTGGDRDIHCWEVAGGRELEPYKGCTSDVYAIAFSADGQYVAAGGADRAVRIWQTSGPAAPLHNLSGHSEPVNALHFTPDGRLLSASHDRTVRLWDVQAGKELGQFYGPEPCEVRSVCPASNGRAFLSGGSDKMVRLWRMPPPDVRAAKSDDPVGEVQSFTGHTATVRRVAFAFDGRHLLSAGYDSSARLWETATGREVLAFGGHQHPHVHTVAFLPDGRQALSGGQDRVVRVWDVRNGQEIRALQGSREGVFNLAVSPDGRRAASCGPEPAVLLWDLERGELIRRLEGLGIGANCVCFSPNGRHLLAGYVNGMIALWDAASNEPKPRLFSGHMDNIASIGFSPDGRLALSASQDKTLRLWDVATGKELQRFTGHTEQIEGAALSPDGRRAISGSFDRTVRLWDVATGKELHRFEGHTDKIWDVAFCPDGRYVASASADMTFRLWRLPFAPFVIGRPLELKPKDAPVAGKLPMPDKAALDKCTEEIRDMYKAEYASRQPSELTALAEKLLQRGQKEYEKPERRFVFLREAGTEAAKAGDPLLSIRALDELGKRFTIAELHLKTAVLQETAKALRTLDASKTLLETARPLLAEAIRTDDYNDAERLLKAAEIAALKTGAPRNSLREDASEVQRLKAKYAVIKPALAKLDQEPKDPGANRLVGSFRCFDKGDWENGLPLLVLGDDTKLKSLAEKDRAAPATVEACTELGDGWWQFAKTASGSRKANLLQRACHWYERALPEAAEPARTRLEANIRSFNKSYPALAWGRLNIAQATVTNGALHLSKGSKEISTRESYSGSIEVTLLARTDKNNIRLYGGKGSYAIFNHEIAPGAVEVGRPDGDKPYTGSKVLNRMQQPLLPNRWYFLSWRISEEGMSLGVNGRAVFSEEHKNDLSEKHPIHVQTHDSDIEVLSVAVRSLDKKP